MAAQSGYKPKMISQLDAHIYIAPKESAQSIAGSFAWANISNLHIEIDMLKKKKKNPFESRCFSLVSISTIGRLFTSVFSGVTVSLVSLTCLSVWC